MKKSKRNIIVSGLAIIFFLSVFNVSNSKCNYNPLAIRIQSLDETVLIDKHVGWVITHGEDPFSDYSTTVNDLQDLGANFSSINSEINNVLLSSYDILVIEEGGTQWLTSELLSLKSWVEDGGALYILGDLPGISQSNVSQYFNVYYNNTDALDGMLTILNSTHPLFEDVTLVESFYPSASLDESKSIDSLEILAITDDEAPIIATLLVEGGHILWNVDSDGIINDFNIGIYDHRQLANNSWVWLATPNPYTGNGPPAPPDLLILIIVGLAIAGAVIIVIVVVVLKRRGKKV